MNWEKQMQFCLPIPMQCTVCSISVIHQSQLYLLPQHFSVFSVQLYGMFSLGEKVDRDLLSDLLGKQLLASATLGMCSTCFKYFLTCTKEMMFIYSNFDIKRKTKGLDYS